MNAISALLEEEEGDLFPHTPTKERPDEDTMESQPSAR